MRDAGRNGRILKKRIKEGMLTINNKIIAGRRGCLVGERTCKLTQFQEPRGARAMLRLPDYRKKACIDFENLFYYE